MKVLATALAIGILAAAGFPVREASSTVGQLRASVQRQALTDGPWQDAGALVMLAGVMFGAAIGLQRRGHEKSPRSG